MSNVTFETRKDPDSNSELKENILVEYSSEEISSHMLYNQENCRVWWKGYYLSEESVK